MNPLLKFFEEENIKFFIYIDKLHNYDRDDVKVLYIKTLDNNQFLRVYDSNKIDEDFVSGIRTLFMIQKEVLETNEDKYESGSMGKIRFEIEIRRDNILGDLVVFGLPEAKSMLYRHLIFPRDQIYYFYVLGDYEKIIQEYNNSIMR